MFMESSEHVKDEPCSGRPFTSTDEQHVAQIRDLVLNDRRMTIKDIIEHVPVSFGSCQAILKDHLGLQLIASRVIQKQQSVRMAQKMLSQDESFLKTHHYG
ncbi:putative uncharacterized protein FLJ37770 [Centruroides sculpturatus]|uniref:putative uncharacterized protein FLJ37770 n=1 Tax=Centruroides sculpturatus TaxID=218467 RepID=UPI000C6D3363|nr:putative uncharacterized protein FLJ37770 [Centruroides sculpturatus]